MSDKAETAKTLVDVYGRKAPDAAKFGVGARDLPSIRDASDARRNAKPGEFGGGKPADLTRRYDQTRG